MQGFSNQSSMPDRMGSNRNNGLVRPLPVHSDRNRHSLVNEMNRHYRSHQGSSATSVICPQPVHAPEHHILEGYGSYSHRDASNSASRYSPNFLDERVTTPYPEFMCHSPFIGMSTSPMPRLTPSPSLPAHDPRLQAQHVRTASAHDMLRYAPDRMPNHSAHSAEAVSYNQLNPHLQGALNSLHKPFTHPYANAVEVGNPQSSLDHRLSNYVSTRSKTGVNYQPSGGLRYGSYQQFYQQNSSSCQYQRGETLPNSSMSLRNRQTKRYPTFKQPSQYSNSYQESLIPPPNALPNSVNENTGGNSHITGSGNAQQKTNTDQIFPPRGASFPSNSMQHQLSPRRVIELDAPDTKVSTSLQDEAEVVQDIQQNEVTGSASVTVLQAPSGGKVELGKSPIVSGSANPVQKADVSALIEVSQQLQSISDNKAHAVPDEQDLTQTLGSLVPALPRNKPPLPSTKDLDGCTAGVPPESPKSRKRPLPPSCSPQGRGPNGTAEGPSVLPNGAAAVLKTSGTSVTGSPSSLPTDPTNVTNQPEQKKENKPSEVPNTSIVPKKEQVDQSESTGNVQKWHKARHREYSKAWRQKKKQEENTLKEEIEQLRKFRTMVEDAPEMMSLISLDQGHPIIFANCAFDRLVRLHGADLKGQPYINIVHHMDQTALAQTLDQMCLLTDLPSVTYRVVNVDLGHVFLVESNFRRVSEGLIVVSTIRDKWYTGSQVLQAGMHI